MNKFKTFTLAATLAGIVVMGLPVAFAQAVAAQGDMGNAVHIERNGEIKLVGTLTAVSSSTLSVQSWGGIWTVDASNVKVVRRFKGESNVSELQVGDQVMIQGQASATGLTVTARMIHDESIQKRNGEFTGKISDLTAGANASSTATFTLTTEKRGAVKVTLTADTKLMINGSLASTTAGLANGMYASVSGIWDRTNSTVIATSVNAKTAATILDEAKPNFFKRFFGLFHKNQKGNKGEDR